MQTNYSTMGLHLCYRLWIAELNSDVTVLRIFDDYLAELKAKSTESGVKKGVAEFQQEFTSRRNEIDELTHSMHLEKMSLAAKAKEGITKLEDPEDHKIHENLEKRYNEYRVVFDKTKKDFVRFENKWLQ